MRRADITDVTCAVVAMALRGAPALYLLLSCPVLFLFVRDVGAWTMEERQSRLPPWPTLTLPKTCPVASPETRTQDMAHWQCETEIHPWIIGLRHEIA